jgi:hypothetical protein
LSVPEGALDIDEHGRSKPSMRVIAYKELEKFLSCVAADKILDESLGV